MPAKENFTQPLVVMVETFRMSGYDMKEFFLCNASFNSFFKT